MSQTIDYVHTYRILELKEKTDEREYLTTIALFRDREEFELVATSDDFLYRYAGKEIRFQVSHPNGQWVEIDPPDQRSLKEIIATHALDQLSKSSSHSEMHELVKTAVEKIRSLP